MITKDTTLIRTIGGKRMVHAIGCPWIQNWNIDGCEPISKLKPAKMKICPVCRRMVFTSIAAKDFQKHRKEYEKFYNDFSVSSTVLEDLIQRGKAKMEIRNEKLYISSKEDDWYIDFRFGEIHLWHNNYSVNDRAKQGVNIVDKGFHEHVLRSKKPNEQVYEAFRQIIKYDFKKATNVHKKKRNPKIKFSELDNEYWGFPS